MSYREFTKAFAAAFLMALALSGGPAHASEADDDQHWADAMDNRQVDLGSDGTDPQDVSAEVKRISKYVQQLKGEVVELNHDLQQMEEQLLFPSSTKYSVFVSFSSGQFFSLESVKLKLNGKLVASHVYSEAQQGAMLRGGIHRLYVTNLNQGEHTATAFFTGIGPSGREYKRAANVDFRKNSNSKYLELAIGDDQVKQEPVFAIKQW